MKHDAHVYHTGWSEVNGYDEKTLKTNAVFTTFVLWINKDESLITNARIRHFVFHESHRVELPKINVNTSLWNFSILVQQLKISLSRQYYSKMFLTNLENSCHYLDWPEVSAGNAGTATPLAVSGKE